MGAALLDLHGRGLQAAIQGNRLRVWPAERITPELREWIRANKTRIMAELSPPSPIVPGALITWRSPLFGPQTGEVVAVLPDGAVEVYHPLTEALVRIPAEWIGPVAEALDDHHRLYPLLGMNVQTPQGRGRLIQAFPGRAAVVLENAPKQVTHFQPAEVWAA